MNPINNNQPSSETESHSWSLQSHHRKGRRQYAADQFEYLAPNQDNQAINPTGVYPATVPMPTDPLQSAYYNSGPEQTPGINSVRQGIDAMNMSNTVLSLNSLQPIDLIGLMPAITSIDAPPPPIILPEKAALRPSETANAPPKYARCTLNAVPTTNGLLKKSNLPFALVIRPYTALHDCDEEVPVVSDQLISRCRRCRAYINPFSIFIESGHRWRCILCNLINDVPQGFDWDLQTNTQRDRWSRAELNYSVVDFIAPQEYMARPPQPLILTFLIDVSRNAVQSGLVATVARSIYESLDRIPNDNGRTKISIIAFDSSLYFFPINPETGESKMLVVSDLEESYLPQHSDLIYNLKQSRKGIEELLEKLIEIFQESKEIGSALGPALQSSHKLISGIGGKMIVFTASLPSAEIGALRTRDDQKAWGTAKESSLLQTQNSFYKSFAVECSKYQITVDMFLFASGYQDVASLSCLPRYTGGQTHYYHNWSALCQEDAIKLAQEISDHISMEVALEAVMRVRGTSNLRMNAFHGNFFNRSSDLCALPSFPRDQGYVVEIAIDDTLNKPFIVLQTAILHTTCHGERRIRTINVAIPTTDKLTDIYAAADQNAIATYLSYKSVEKVLSSGLDSGRSFIMDRLLAILETFRKQLTGQNTGASLPLRLSSNLSLLPLICLALSKHIGLRRGQVLSDLRSAALDKLSTLPPALLLPYIIPRLYGIHNMPDNAGLPDYEGIVLPPRHDLTYIHLDQFGLYLIDDGQDQVLWLGREAVPQLLQDFFGVDSYTELPMGKFTLPYIEDSIMNQRLHNILSKLRTLDKGKITYPTLWLVRPDSSPVLQKNFASMLILDKSDAQPSYFQFLNQLKEKINS